MWLEEKEQSFGYVKKQEKRNITPLFVVEFLAWLIQVLLTWLFSCLGSSSMNVPMLKQRLIIKKKTDGMRTMAATSQPRACHLSFLASWRRSLENWDRTAGRGTEKKSNSA
ncbi:hypothetical protein BRADI_1g27576v3 [Brachypodium distachyon]|uniref:Uncharacterized protein n=1 Tax=Brachypodium distachyon TaxID=15368 RepID=A0A0Q3RT25_BRADI|nr:hypothetical protein BRADI_1g27576v3 [Brachypodium distachyon]